MATGVRDVDVGSEVQELLAAGYFDDEISFCGCAYVEAQRIYYRINEQEEAIWRFIRQGMSRGLCPTPLARIYRRKKILSGKREEIKAQVRTEFLLQLQRDYPRAYFEALAPLAVTPANNSAYELLRQWREMLLACFAWEEIQLFSGVVQMSYEAKLLTESSYSQLAAWADDRLRQISRQNRSKGQYGRLYSGFAYREEDGWHYFYDANDVVACRRRWQLMEQGRIVTPFFQKHYWSDVLRTGMLGQMEQQFGETLRQLMEGAYLQRIEQIRQLPAAIPVGLYRQQRKLIEDIDQKIVSKAFTLWSSQWNCWP